MLTLNDGRAELWQWDTGRTLSVDADCSQVHFSNKVFGRSIDVDVVDGAAVIPDILLQTDKDLNVWAFVGTADNGYTKISKTFKVNRRNKPADYVFTPPDQTSIEEIKERLEYLEQNPVVPDLSNYATKDEIPDVSGFATKAEIPVVPKALPNPNALTLTGAVNATYDGSTAVSVEIPSGGSGGTDISLGLTSAAVGQIIKVKAIDESGKPTAWEAADMPSGGGETWEKISDVSLTQDVSSYILASFGAYRKIKIIMERDAYVSGLSKNVWLRISLLGVNDFYVVGYITFEYGYKKWEATAEVNNAFISGHIMASNNPNAAASLNRKVSKELGDTAVSDLSLHLNFTDVSVIQDGDSVSVWGVRW